MRWIGYFLLTVLGIFIILLFIKIKIEILIQNQTGWIEFRYLWLKYRVNLDDLMSQSMKEEVKEQVQEVKEATESKVMKKEVKTDVKVKKVTEVETVDQPSIKDHQSKKIRVTKEEKFKEKKVKKQLNLKKLKKILHRFKRIFKESKIVLRRVTKQIKINKLDSWIEFSVNDAMTTGCLLGVIWGIQANIYALIERYVKKIESYHFNVTSKFNGNSILLNLSCILSFRLGNIIIVLLLSFKELLRIKRLVKLEEER